LRCLFLARHRPVDRTVAGDLEKYTHIWAAFVDLAGRVKKSRPKPRQVATRLLSRKTRMCIAITGCCARGKQGVRSNRPTEASRNRPQDIAQPTLHPSRPC
jgi:hypothetical protein